MIDLTELKDDLLAGFKRYPGKWFAIENNAWCDGLEDILTPPYTYDEIRQVCDELYEEGIINREEKDPTPEEDGGALFWYQYIDGDEKESLEEFLSSQEHEASEKLRMVHKDSSLLQEVKL